MLKQIVSSLGIEDIPESWERNNDYANAHYPDGGINFLQDHHLDYIGERVHLSEQKVQWIRETMAVIRKNEHLSRLAWLWHCILYRNPDPEREAIIHWPFPIEPASQREMLTGFFPAVVLLSGYDCAKELHNERHIPEEILVETFDAVGKCMDFYERSTGSPGLGMRYLNWLQHHFHARLYRFGRLEYEMRTFLYPLRVYRHLHEDRLIALSDDGVKYRADGLIDGTNNIYAENDGWTATLTETEDGIVGYPISPDEGIALNEQLTLVKSDWQLALSKGDPTVSIHIPRGGAFRPDACRDSFARAAKFFQQYYVDRPYAAVTCISWLMDPQLQQLLAESSNLVQFQKWFHPYPTKSGDASIYTFVFGLNEKCDIEQLPEDTSLQRKMKAFMQADGHLHNAGGFILPEKFGV